MNGAQINVHIQELVLHDIDRRDRDRLSAALQAELTKRLIESGLPQFDSSVEIAALNIGGVPLGRTSQATGTQIGAAVHGLLNATPTTERCPR